MATPISIEIKKSSNTCYFVGETSNVKVRSINVTYDDGTVKALTSGYTVSQVDTSEAGEKISIVEYSGLTVELTVTVVDSYNVQAGTPNLEDVNITFDLETGLLKVTGTGEFLSLSNIENTPSSIKTRIKKVNIGNGITKIPVDAFGGNKNLEDISFPNTLEEICDGNFYSTKITQIVFPQSLKKIGKSCFSSSALISLEIPDSILEIGSSSFSNLSSLKKVIFHEGLETISPVAFNECPLITELALPSTLKNMQYNFQGSSLESLEMGGEGTIFSSSGSERISNISAKSMTIRGGTIDNGAFYYNNTVENLSLGEAVKWNGSGQFNGCSNLTDVSISNGITSIPENCFRDCSSLDNVVFPGSITEIGGSVFSGCSSLKNITLSKNLKSIPSYCFSKCAFETFSIPDNFAIETLGDVLFQNCSNLTSVYIGNNVKTIGSGCFYGADSLATIRINQKENAISGAPWAASNATVEWGNAILTGIEITTLPTKTSYKKGDVFDNSGLTVTATYDDGTTKKITGYTLSSPDMTSPGEKTITVTYQEKTATFNITVYDIISIKVKEYFGKTSVFFIGDENTGTYRYAAKSLTVTYENGEEETVSYGNFTETLVDTSKAGSYYTTISYKGKEIQNPYTVYGSPFTTTTGYPDKESATATLDLNTGVCTILGTNQVGVPVNTPRSFGEKIKELKISEGIIGIYRFTFCSNITLLDIPSTVEELSEGSLPIYGITGILGSGGFSTAIIRINAKKDSISGSPWGQKSATIIWTAKPQSLNIKTLPDKLKYTVGDTFDPTGIECKVQYSNGKEYNLDGELSYSVNMSESGKQTVTVSCTEEDTVLTAKFQIEIEAPEKVKGIRISKYPDKTYYKIGDSLDTSGMEVMKVTESGKETVVTNYQTSGFNSSKAGTNTVRVIYTEVISDTESETFSTTFQVQITNDGQNPFEENSDPINITVHWINGEFEDLTNENIQQSSVTLQESICSENYFIFGGCVCNQISFSAHHKQFDGTGEEYYPTGKIEVYLERNKTKLKIFTGEIDTAERASNSLTRNFVAYDYLYKLRNTDIAWWYKNRTVDSQMVFTQKQFRDALFAYLGIEQVETTLEYDNASVPNTNVSNEINAINIIKDLCLQNSVFGWMNRDGKFEYLKLPENSYQFGTTVSGAKIYKYFEAQIHLDTFKSFYAKEGRIWFPQEFMADPYPGIFSSGEPSAQEAYEKNIYHNRNSFFVGNQDWLNMAFDADEYGVYTRSKPLVNLCYGTTSKLDPSHLYRAQEYTAEVVGNPFNMVGQTVEMKTIKYLEDGTELPVLVNSYIMSRVLKISGGTSLIDTYSAKNSPYNGNNQQLGKYTPEISATVNQTRSELPTISYEEFSDGTDIAMLADDIATVKKTQLRCVKRIKKSDYDALVASGNDRKDTLYFTYEEG